MSHEIRTPMNAIIGMSGLMLDTMLTRDQREFAEIIRTSGDALLTIINDILDFSKIEAGKMELESQPFDLRDCVESALDLIATRASEKQLDVAYLMDTNVPEMITGDVTRLRQILINLLNNAVKFTERGEVVITVKAEEGGEKKDEVSPSSLLPLPSSSTSLHFSVRDTGIGIPADKLSRLFQSFSQVDASTTRKYGGTGLGLVISKRLSELMGGTMWVESTGEAGQGSTFHFTLQTQAIAVQEKPRWAGEQPSLAGKRILVVDDNATNRRILQLQAGAWGMTIDEADSGLHALKLLKNSAPYDVVILDMHMPEMDGMELAAAIRQHYPPAKLPLIMFSSLGRRELGADTLNFAAYLTKPLKASQLHDVLVTLFLGASPLPAAVASESVFDETLGKEYPLRILLAEDNQVNQKLATRLLQKLSYRADIASNGLEVLQALDRQPYDVVLMDVQMPEMDGLEATRQVRATVATQQPYIIGLTANAMQGDREMCLDAGMDDYVTKPIQVKELINALKRAAERLASPVSN